MPDKARPPHIINKKKNAAHSVYEPRSVRVNIIACVSENNVIGFNNKMPWKLSADMIRFKTLTTGKPVIMGRKTYESIGSSLANRVNIIITSDSTLYNINCKEQKTVFVGSLSDAIRYADDSMYGEVFVIGGQQVYEDAIPYANHMYITEIYGDFKGDRYFPEFNALEWEVMYRGTYSPDSENEFAYDFIEYRRIAPPL